MLCKVTAQDMFRPIPGPNHCTAVIKKWGLLSYAENAVQALALSKRSIVTPLLFISLCSCPSCSCLLFKCGSNHNHHVLLMCKDVHMNKHTCVAKVQELENLESWRENLEHSWTLTTKRTGSFLGCPGLFLIYLWLCCKWSSRNTNLCAGELAFLNSSLLPVLSLIQNQ